MVKGWFCARAHELLHAHLDRRDAEIIVKVWDCAVHRQHVLLGGVRLKACSKRARQSAPKASQEATASMELGKQGSPVSADREVRGLPQRRPVLYLQERAGHRPGRKHDT